LISNNKDISNLSFIGKLSILSIDIVIGSVACGAFVVELLNVQPGFVWWVILPFSVWIVYSLDHLIDGIIYKSGPPTIRRLFYNYYKTQIIVIVILLTIINIIFVFGFLKEQIRIFGLYLCLFTVIYLLLVYLISKKKQLLFQKELFVAVIYTIGIWGGPISLLNYSLTFDQSVILVSFFVLVLADILVLNLYEKESDRINGLHSFVISFGEKTTVYLVRILIFIVFLVCSQEIVITTINNNRN